jgi:hypothetical protein
VANSLFHVTTLSFHINPCYFTLWNNRVLTFCLVVDVRTDHQRRRQRRRPDVRPRRRGAVVTRFIAVITRGRGGGGGGVGKLSTKRKSTGIKHQAGIKDKPRQRTATSRNQKPCPVSGCLSKNTNMKKHLRCCHPLLTEADIKKLISEQPRMPRTKRGASSQVSLIDNACKSMMHSTL